MNETRESAVSFLNSTLQSAVFESFIVRRDTTQLRFISGDGQGADPVWLSETSAVSLQTARRSHDQRSSVVGYLHAALGKKIEQIQISEAGVLSLHLGAALVWFAPDAVNLERIWSITPGAPDSPGRGGWRVSLNDELQLEFEQP